MNNVHITFVPGSTYANAEPEASEPQKERTRGEARADAIKQFQRTAQGQMVPEITKITHQLLATLIQFKALGGSMAGHSLVAQIREAADFMEDL